MGTELNFEAADYQLRSVLFSEWKFRIPRYQRPYSWADDQLSEFWTDLIGSEYPYFFGSFIFNNEPLKATGFVEVIDGQQRLLTVTILSAVLRDLAKELDSKFANIVQRKDIAFEDWRGEISYRIECGDSARPFFEKYIQSQESSIIEALPNSKEEVRIKANYDFFLKKVKAELDRFDSNEMNISYMKQLRDKLASLVVIRIDIYGEEDAYEIFETTNARGIDLSIADLLKNLIFKKMPAQDDRDIAKELWSDIVSNVQDTGTELKKFIRYFWISKNTFVTEKNIFREIKRQTTDWYTLLNDIESASRWYNKLIEGSREDWPEFKSGAKIFKSISALRAMNVSQCYVLLLSILRNFKHFTDASRIFQLIEKFTFNYSAVCKLPTNKLERLYSSYAKGIENTVRNENIERIPSKIQGLFAQFEKELQDERPSSDLFKERFADIEYVTSQKSRDLIKYILGEINAIDQTGEHKIDFDNVSIEHILPQTPSKQWNLNKKEIKNYVNKIGNLTLVGKGFNSKVKNKIIQDKIVEYEKSEVLMTKKLVEHIRGLNHTWGENQIHQRTEKFADIAYLKIWKL